ncbi:MAG: MBL fold metallo-hydrolase [Deltaproteobacteria bacterium]|nr:MBL fold metallo-hydrolase [Candidatus Anaeroferrophillus wilburensis]MBN2889287.1 MBL fold metallo-hydrolase [Deltaproteobacteria bacterium]
MILETVVVGPLQVNCYIVGCEQSKKAAVIDPGDNVDAILAALAGHKLTVQYIINTHEHFDHVGGNKRLKEVTGAKLLAHEKAAAEIVNISSRAAIWGMQAEDSPAADRFLQEGDQVIVGDSVTLEVFETPGHSLGSICLATSGAVFVGDLIFAGSIGRTDFPGGDYQVLLSSVREKVFTLDNETVIYPGHGPATTVGREKLTNPFFT